MNEHIQDGMDEATHLTRTGRLAEATAMIQRILKGKSAGNTSQKKPDKAAGVIEGEFRVVDDVPADKKDAANLGKRAFRREEKPLEQEFSAPATGGHKIPHPATPPPPSLRDTPTFRSTPPIRHKASPGSSTPEYARRQFVDGVYSNTEGTRTYKLYIPGGYTGQAVPLVIMLHGCTQTCVDFASGTGMNVLAEERTFLVAYPEQATGANNSRCWNWFQAKDQWRDMGEPSLIAGMTQQIMSEYHVDARRVYIAGMSAGGAMAAVMAATYPDLYAAVGVHSGLAYGAAHDLLSGFTAMNQGASSHTQQLNKAIPLIAFHGDRDTTVAPVNTDSLLDQWLQAPNNVSGNGKRAIPDAKVEHGKATRGHAYTRFIYSDAHDRTIAEKWIVHQAGHAWAGGNSGGSFTDPRGPNASAEMLRFFNEHPKER